MKMSEQYEWVYRCSCEGAELGLGDLQGISLVDDEESLGNFIFERDEEGRIKLEDSALFIKADRTDLEQFYTHVWTTPGIDPQDKVDLIRMKDHFYLMEKPMPGVTRELAYLCTEDPENAEEMKAAVDEWGGNFNQAIKLASDFGGKEGVLKQVEAYKRRALEDTIRGIIGRILEDDEE